jgi:hypothetical protein
VKFTSGGCVFEVVETSPLDSASCTHSVTARRLGDERVLLFLAVIVNGFVVNAQSHS